MKIIFKTFLLKSRYLQFSSVQLVSRVWLLETPCIAAHQASLSITNSQSSLKLVFIQPSHPLSSPSPPAPNPSQHQSLFQWLNSLHEVAKVEFGVSASASVLPKNTQDWSPLEWTGLISLQSKGLSQESYPTPQFKSINFSALSLLHSPTLTPIYDHWKNHSLD